MPASESITNIYSSFLLVLVLSFCFVTDELQSSFSPTVSFQNRLGKTFKTISCLLCFLVYSHLSCVWVASRVTIWQGCPVGHILTGTLFPCLQAVSVTVKSGNAVCQVLHCSPCSESGDTKV